VRRVAKVQSMTRQRGGEIEATAESVAKVLRNTPVLWVGAGASAAAGYPSTADLVRAMVEEAADPLDTNASFFEVADAFVETMGAGPLSNLMERSFSQHRRPTSLHLRLSELAADGMFHTIITTNYDDLLENALRSKGVHYVLQVIDQNQHVSLPPGSLRLVKIHGSRESWLKTVLSGRSYDHFRVQHRFLQEQLNVILAQQAVLFVGCSMKDPTILDWLSCRSETEIDQLNIWRPVMTARAWHQLTATIHDGRSAAEILASRTIRPLIVASHEDTPDLLRAAAEVGRSHKPTVARVQAPARSAKLATDLDAADVLGYRNKYYNPFYYVRDHDANLRRHIEKSHNVLVLGEPLSGKTRAAFEALRLQHDTEVIFPSPEEMHNGFQLPSSRTRRLIAFLDDVDVYFERGSPNEMLVEFLQQGVSVVATCRTGPEYGLFSQAVTPIFTEGLRYVRIIKKLQSSDLQAFPQDVLAEMEDPDSEFDGNIGSLFIKLQQMRRRYDSIQKSNSSIDKVCCLVLKALKMLYFSSNFETKSTYRLQKVRDLAERLHLSTTANFEQRNLPTLRYQLLKGLEHEYREFAALWHQALQKLKNDDNGLSFIEVRGKIVGTEEVYLERVVDHTYTSSNALADIVARYPDARERGAAGFFVKAEKFNRLLGSSATYDAALSVYAAMTSASIRPTRSTFDALITKANDFAIGAGWLGRMRKDGQNASVSTFSILIKSASSAEHLRTLFAEMEIDGLIDEAIQSGDWARDYSVAIRRVIQHACGEREMVDMLACLVESPFTLGLSLWRLLLEKSSSFAQARNVAAGALAVLTDVDDQIFVPLIEKASSWQEAKETLSLIQEAGAEPAVEVLRAAMALWAGSPDEVEKLPAHAIVYNKLIERAADFDAALVLLCKMKDRGIFREAATYRFVMQTARSYADVQAVCEQMDEPAKALDLGTARIMAMKTASRADFADVRRRMKTAGLNDDPGVFRVRLSRADWQEIEELLEEADSLKMPFVSRTVHALLNKADSLEILEKIVVRMEHASIGPGAAAFRRMLESETPDDGMENVGPDPDPRLRVDIGAITILRGRIAALRSHTKRDGAAGQLVLTLHSAPSLADALKIVDERDQKLTPALVNALIQRSKNSAEAIEVVLPRADAAGVEMERSILLSLIQKASSYDEAIELWERYGRSARSELVVIEQVRNKVRSIGEIEDLLSRMIGAGHQIAPVTYRALLYQSDSPEAARLVWQRLVSAQVQLNSDLYGLLASKMSTFGDTEFVVLEMESRGFVNEAAAHVLSERATTAEEIARADAIMARFDKV